MVLSAHNVPRFLGIQLCERGRTALEFCMSIFRRLSRWLGANDGMTHIASGNLAPGFTLRSLDGKEFSLSKALGNGPVVLSFFKVSCPVCQFTFPFLERLFQRYGGDGVTFLGVSQDDAGASRDFAKKFGVTFPVLPDDSGYAVSNAYGLTMVPTIFLIEPDGKVRVSSMGFVRTDLESIAGSLADRRKITRSPVFLSNESIPAIKPG
jgi:Peroxiredoxin